MGAFLIPQFFILLLLFCFTVSSTEGLTTTLKREKMVQEQTSEMPWTPISLEDLTTAAKCIANWKAFGLDGLPNFWLKYPLSAHNHLVNFYQ